ncbi:sigma-E factor negative regulatory protein [Sedimenticola hydrogenitrophicus]|uniref:sigma-E factor negative regulatory protein n=1 Tax=Sedimenticola hydrogenitrophicus TaxID=2967975 RepID=UPI0023B18EC2|nr:sigma-E factor negative regulatory protein [Sedimenticola hydrogenitrophicus]
MTDDINEQISALLDNELNQKEFRHTLDLLEEDASLRGSWDRYTLIGDAMRGEAVRFSADSIADRVKRQLEREPVNFPLSRPLPTGRLGRFPSRWYKSAGGAALAASVAVITVLAFPQLTDMTPEPGGQVIAEHSVPDPKPYLVQSSTRWKNLSEPKVESKLNSFLIDHNEYAAPGGIGVIPYANFVSYDSNR